jgi:PIN domain nuclease of toxin-antitoxin system
MRILPDTHALVWWIEDAPRLSDRVRALMDDDANPLLFSAATAWEIRIKQAVGKLEVPDGFDLLDDAGAVLLPIEHRHAEAAAALPLHHRDPFDRMLIAQAQLEDAVLLSADPVMRLYDVRVAW